MISLRVLSLTPAEVVMYTVFLVFAIFTVVLAPVLIDLVLSFREAQLGRRACAPHMEKAHA